MLLAVVVMWILAILPRRFGLPWGSISYISTYGALLVTALVAIKVVQDQRNSTPSAQAKPAKQATVKRCSTCETFREFTQNFNDVTPKVEALYMEHLVREHNMEP